MADKISKEKRSDNMSKIRGRNTLLETKVRKQLFKQGVRYRLNYPLFGKPDITIPSKRIAIFVNGCFWHQHQDCKLAYMPKSNVDFWKSKLLKNIERDELVKQNLVSDNWNIIYLWECDIEKRFDITISDLMKKIEHYV